VKASQYGAPLLLRFAAFQVWKLAPGLPIIVWAKDVVQIADTAIAISKIRRVLGPPAEHSSWKPFATGWWHWLFVLKVCGLVREFRGNFAFDANS
jgi:hypothetical protein